VQVLIGRLPGDVLTNITDDLKYGEKGYSYIIDKSGVIRSHENRELVLNQTNYIEMAKEDKSFEDLARLITKMTKGETGFDEYMYLGSVRYMGFSPIPGTDWSLALGSLKSEVFAPVYKMRIIFIILIVLFVVLGYFASAFLAKTIYTPINKLNDNLKDISEGDGDLTKRLEVTSRDEIGDASANFNSFIDKIHIIITDISKGVVALNQNSQSLGQTANSLVKQASTMNAQSQLVSASSEQISSNANVIASSAEQASTSVATVAAATEEMATNIAQVSIVAKNTTDNVNKAVVDISKLNNNMVTAGGSIDELVHEITGVVSAIEEMNATIAEIAKNTQHASDISLKASKEADIANSV
ncbi:MAG TPA: methyl-accepting chemotaxis protein, partial [Candidatus Cloacimonadota bacterium]|nr:methyl-accepting chemotaxis protein [Candidatus Cloacimonadota bacterium]